MSNVNEKESEILYVNLYGWRTIQPGAIHKTVPHTSIMPDAELDIHRFVPKLSKYLNQIQKSSITTHLAIDMFSLVISLTSLFLLK